jgi:hypothetical protein
MVSMSKPFMMNPTHDRTARSVCRPELVLNKDRRAVREFRLGQQSFDNLAGAGDKIKAELDVPEQPRIMLFAGPNA